MQQLRRYLFPFVFVLFCLGLFMFSYAPIGANDTFFGIAIGRYIWEHRQIPGVDVFSWSAQGRPWIAYEWLAQTLLYILYAAGSLSAISVAVSVSLVTFFIIFYLLVTKVLGNDRWFGLILSLFTAVSVSGFFVARPQIISFLALATTFTLIMNFLLHKKDRLWWIVPVTYLWANSHASFIMSPLLLFSYAVLGRSKRLAVVGVVSSFVTFFPPLGYKPYQLLWEFGSDMAFISQSVLEWMELTDNPLFLRLYEGLLASVLTISLILSWRNKLSRRWLLVVPLLGITILSFQAVRHIVYGTIASVVLFSFFAGSLKAWSRWILSLLLLSMTIWLGSQTRPDPNPPLPSQQDLAFLNTHHVNGNMYNEFSLGGFLMYATPQYPVFFDGRVEVYHGFEMRSLWPLISEKHSGRETFRKTMYSFFETYQFSWVIVPYNSYNPMEFTVSSYIADILLDDPKWALVYASDYLEILVARDGKNDAMIKKFELSSATPFRLTPYRTSREKEAIADYERLLESGESGIGFTGLGVAAATLGDKEKAQTAFQRATQINPRLGKPYLGLGKLALTSGNKQQAVAFLEQAIAKEPYLGEASILLGQLYLEAGRKTEALSLWNKTLEASIDFISKQKIVQLREQAR